MDRRDFSDLEDQIMSTVKNALNAIDFANLKRDISGKAEDTLNEFKSKVNEYNSKIENKYGVLTKKPKNDVYSYISKRPAGSLSGIFYMIFGSIGSAIFGFLVFIFLIFMTVRGISLRRRVKRFKKYVRFIEDDSYFLIKDLAKLAKEKEAFVIKDLNKMISLGMFIEGHIDDEKTYFMLNDDVYGDYLNLKRQQMDKESKKEKLKEDIDNSEKEEVRLIIETGRKYINQIKIISSSEIR